MNMGNKKTLAAKTLKVGKDRIVFDKTKLAEIKEAITKEDIRGLVSNKAIAVSNAENKHIK